MVVIGGYVARGGAAGQPGHYTHNITLCISLHITTKQGATCFLDHDGNIALNFEIKGRRMFLFRVWFVG